MQGIHKESYLHGKGADQVRLYCRPAQAPAALLLHGTAASNPFLTGCLLRCAPAHGPAMQQLPKQKSPWHLRQHRWAAPPHADRHLCRRCGTDAAARGGSAHGLLQAGSWGPAAAVSSGRQARRAGLVLNAPNVAMALAVWAWDGGARGTRRQGNLACNAMGCKQVRRKRCACCQQPSRAGQPLPRQGTCWVCCQLHNTHAPVRAAGHCTAGGMQASGDEAR